MSKLYMGAGHEMETGRERFPVNPHEIMMFFERQKPPCMKIVSLDRSENRKNVHFGNQYPGSHRRRKDKTTGMAYEKIQPEKGKNSE